MESFDVVKVLRSTLKTGVRTSEFWVTILTLAAPLLYKLVEDWLGTLPPNSTLGIIAGAVYVAVRSIVKGITARKALDAAPIASAGMHAAAHEEPAPRTFIAAGPNPEYVGPGI